MKRISLVGKKLQLIPLLLANILDCQSKIVETGDETFHCRPTTETTEKKTSEQQISQK